MIPKLALNFSINKDTDISGYPELFDRLRANKIIYMEIIIHDIEKLDDLKPFLQVFKTMRNSKHIDYTIWLGAGDYAKSHAIYVEANKLNKLVMGITSPFSPDDVQNHMNCMLHSSFPDVYDLMLYTDKQALENSKKALEFMHAPEGMKLGLERVIEDYIKLYGAQVLRSEEPQPVSDQDSE